MGGLVEGFVVIDAKYRAAARRRADPGHLRREEPRGDARHHHKSRKTVIVRHAGANRKARDLRAGPLDGKRERRAAEHAEVIGPVRVLPHVFRVHHQVPPKSLLEAGVELIAASRNQRHRIAGVDRRHDRVHHRVVASQARKSQVLVERCFHRTGIGSPDHRVGGLDVVCDAEARLQHV